MFEYDDEVTEDWALREISRRILEVASRLPEDSSLARRLSDACEEVMLLVADRTAGEA